MTQIPAPQAPPPVIRPKTESSFQQYMQQQMMPQQRPAPMAVQQYYPPQPYPHQYHPYAPHPQQMQMAPGQYPASVYQLNYQVPGYLSTPELRTYDGSVWGLLGREVLRAVFKAMGHAIASHFDSQPFRLPPPPPPSGGGQQ